MRNADSTDKRYWFFVGALTLIGAWLRLDGLGDLGFRWDEDLSSLAVQAILEHGFPQLPSGMIYWRGGAFLYLMGASAELFGFSEFSLRLPAAAFGIATIPLGFVFGRMLFDSKVGLLLAALLTFSFWDVEFSRYARMYAPFQFFYLLTVVSIWRYRIVTTSLAGGIVAIGLAMAAISLHLLGYTLALIFLLSPFIRGDRLLAEPQRAVFPLAACGSVGLFFLGWRNILETYRHLPMQESANASAMPALADAVETAAATPVSDGSGLDGILAMIASAVPELPLLQSAWQQAPVAAALLVAVIFLPVGFLLRRDAGISRMEVVGVCLVGLFCAMQIFNFAILGLLALAFCRREGVGAFRGGAIRATVGMIVLGFAGWIVISAALGLNADMVQGVPGAVRQSVRTLLDYPSFAIFWGFPNERPMMSVVALIGGVWAFDRAARQTPDRAALFLMLVLAAPLVLNGLFETQYELFRYNVPFDPYFFCFCALGLLRWRQITSLIRSGRDVVVRRLSFAPAVTALLVLLVVSYDLNPLQTWLVTQRSYSNEGFLYRFFGMMRYPDFKTPAEYVANHAASDDRIVALDCREYFNYLGRLDYWVRSAIYDTQTYRDGDTLRDLYVSTPLVMDTAELTEVLDASPERTTWLIVNDVTLARTRAVSEEMKTAIRSRQGRAVYVGRDGSTKVYRID